MRNFLFSLIFLVLFSSLIYAENPFSAVVKINAVYCSPNFSRPWVKNSQYNGSGSGVVIKGNKILTNAHNVTYATYITVLKENDGTPVSAKVEAVDHQCDLALLSVEDESFFSDITPMEFGETPAVRTPVLAVGYPMGGDGLSVTQGIISRIEIMRYTHSAIDSFLAAQLDAALNPGNSGGPIIYDGKIVGIAFQIRSNGNSIGYMIHSEIIEHFLKDLEDGKVDGFGMLQARMLGLENPDTRKFLKMKDGQSGVLICEIAKIPGVDCPIKEGDVILSVDGFKVMNNGNIRTPDNTNRFFTTLIHAKQMGESVNMKILRNGEQLDVAFVPHKYCDRLEPMLYDVEPSMFMIGGFVFTKLSLSFLNEWGDNVPPTELSDEIGKDRVSHDSELVVLSETLGDEVNMGYQFFSNMILESVNGKKIENLKDLADTIDALDEGFATFKFKGKLIATLDVKKMKAARDRIMKNYGMTSDRSADLAKIN